MNYPDKDTEAAMSAGGNVTLINNQRVFDFYYVQEKQYFELKQVRNVFDVWPGAPKTIDAALHMTGMYLFSGNFVYEHTENRFTPRLMQGHIFHCPDKFYERGYRELSITRFSHFENYRKQFVPEIAQREPPIPPTPPSSSSISPTSTTSTIKPTTIKWKLSPAIVLIAGVMVVIIGLLIIFAVCFYYKKQTWDSAFSQEDREKLRKRARNSRNRRKTSNAVKSTLPGGQDSY